MLKNIKYTASIFILQLIFSAGIFPQKLPTYNERNMFSLSNKSEQEQKENNFASLYQSVLDPDKYILGAGDKFFISVRGIEDKSFDAMINAEGTIFIPKVGLINLKNISLAEGKQIIKNEILRNFKLVEIDIALVRVKTIKVNLIGDVSVPAAVTIPATSRLNDLLLNSAGILETADLRNVVIIDDNGIESKYDLLSFLRLGDESQNPYLHDGSIVKINKADRMVSIFGAVPYYGTYELVENEPVINFIELTGGFTDRARTDTIEIVRFDSLGKEMVSHLYSKDELRHSNLTLKSGDKILVREKPEYQVDRIVSISGYVKYPGLYKIEKGKTKLSELINESGGFLDDASLKDSYVIRAQVDNKKEIDPEFERLKLMQRMDMTDDEYDYFKAKSRERKGRMVVDFTALFDKKDSTEDMVLRKGDKIFVPESRDYITLVGQVVNPGNIIYRKNYSVDDYIKSAGGYAWRAVENDVRIVKAKTGEWIEADDVISLEPGDIIWVPEEPPPPKFWDIFTTSLTVVAQLATVITAVVAIIVATRN